MRSYHAHSGAGIAGLTLKEHPAPQPGPRQVVVRVRANSLNFRELSVLRGTYPLPVKPDVVMAAQIGGSLDGMLTELALVDEDAVVGIPEHLSFEEAATLPCAAVTAWNALTGARRLQAGDTVLTLGSGGVSLFALQLGKLFGARVIATTSSDDKARRLRALGADHVINYRTTPDWHLEVRKLTGGRGVDQVVEVGGGTLERSIKATAVEGQINFIGRLDTTSSALDANVLYGAIATLRVVAAGSRAHFVAMNRAIAASRMRPVIDRAFDFDDVPAAFRYFESAQPFGKVVITHPR